MRMVSMFPDRRRESGGIISFGWIGRRGSILGYVEYLEKKIGTLNYCGSEPKNFHSGVI